MSTLQGGEELPDAQVRVRRRGLSPIWIVPLAALIAGIWLVVKTVTERGPSVLIHFESAEGIEAGKTRVKYLDVDLGLVTSVRLAGTGVGVDVEAELIPGSESRLTESTRFWIVKPRLDATGVSGLGTLFSGTYIGMDPGAGGAAKNEFDALNDPPRILSHQSGSIYRLWSEELGSLAIGAPVYFRKIPVGSVVSYALSEDHSQVLIEVFIESPHDEFVDIESRFWNVSGVQIEAGSDGVEINLESMASLAAGGIAFDTPEIPRGRDQVGEDHLFTLYRSKKDSQRDVVVGTYPFLVYFDDSVRGLSPDAPVEFRGLRVGQVRDILPATMIGPGEVRIGVLVGLDPEALPFSTESTESTGWKRRLEWVQRMADSGARAQLQTGNLLTGQKFVDIDLFPSAPPVEVVTDLGYPVIPSMPGALAGLTESMAGILSKVESLPIRKIGRDIEGATAGINRLVNSENFTQAVEHFAASAEKLDQLLANSAKASEGLGDLIAGATTAVDRLESTLSAVELATSEDGVIGAEALDALRELSAAARAFRAMAEYLERHPEALISGKQQGE